MATRFPVRVDDEGRLVPLHPERTRRLRGRDRWVSLHEDPKPAIRSDAANAYLWGVVYAAISEATGNDPDSIHYGLKREAVRVGILEPEYIALGDYLLEADPTTRTDPDTFQRYTTWIRHEAEHGKLTGARLHIPEPNEGKEVA
jgi:hypothetical protein